MRCKRNALLEINHSLQQRRYVDWKYRELEQFVSTAPKPRASNGARIAYRFTTRSVPELTSLYHRFYLDGRKRIPAVNLSPLVLAVWFMDDGSRTHRAVYLNTQQFNLEEQLRLIDLLRTQHGIDATLNRDKIYRGLRIAVASMPVFGRLVERHLLPELRYKLPV